MTVSGVSKAYGMTGGGRAGGSGLVRLSLASGADVSKAGIRRLAKAVCRSSGAR
ncbi:MAG: hypothetical protein ACRDK0_06375 [Solirubrobacteraceae bacterium]